MADLKRFLCLMASRFRKNFLRCQAILKQFSFLEFFVSYLAYTVAIDSPRAGGHRTLAKLLGGSLVRTLFSGEFVVFRSSPEPIFQVERKGITEIHVEVGATNDLEHGTEQAWGMKYRVRDLVQELIDEGGYEKVMFIDTDCLAIRNIDHLLEGDWDISYYVERGRPIQDQVFSCFLSDEEYRSLRHDGINSGTLAVRSSVYREVMTAWQGIDTGEAPRDREFSEQGAWNRLILDCHPGGDRWERTKRGGDNEKQSFPWRTKRFERDSIQLPLFLHHKYQDYTEAALVHCLGADIREKIRFMFGLYMSTFYCDDAATFLHLLEM
jgi:hypothetical protein